MTRTLLAPSLLAVALLLSPGAGLPLAAQDAAPAADDQPVRTLDQGIPAGDAGSIHAILRIGDLEVVGTDDTEARAELAIRCDSEDRDRCIEAARNIALAWVRDNNVLRLRVTGTSRLASRHIWVKTRLTVPRNLPLEIDVGVGDVFVTGVRSDAEVDVGAGNVDLRLRKADVRVVNLDVNAGSAEVYVDGGKVEGSGLVHKALNWKGGEGKAVVEVDVGSGDARIRLE